MRGLRRNHLIDHFLRGIIPAHAGLTSIVPLSRKSVRDHPRPCGAYSDKDTEKIWVAGSSPPMRGLLTNFNQSLSFKGIIPAHAGLTSSPSDYLRLFRDHPRPCGAYITKSAQGCAMPGSSPPMRGLRVDCSMLILV